MHQGEVKNVIRHSVKIICVVNQHPLRDRDLNWALGS